MSLARFGASSVSVVSLLIPVPALKGFFVSSHWPDDPAAVSSPFSQHNQWNHSGCSTACTYKAPLHKVSNCVAYKLDRRRGDRQPRYLVSEGNAQCDIVMRQLIKQLTSVRQETAGPVIVTEPSVLGKWHFHQVNRRFPVFCFSLCDSLVSWCEGEHIIIGEWQAGVFLHHLQDK